MIDLNLKVSEFIENKQWNTHRLGQCIDNQDIIPKILGVAIQSQK